MSSLANTDQIIEITFKPKDKDVILKVDSTHKEYIAAFKTGYLAGFQLDWIEMYVVQEQGCRAVLIFPSREATVIHTNEIYVSD